MTEPTDNNNMVATPSPETAVEPVDRTAFDLRTLAKAVDDASARIEKDRLAQEARISSSVHKMRWQRRFAFIGVLAGVIGITLSLLSIGGIRQNEVNVRDARITGCLSYNNDIAVNVNALNDRTQDLLRLSASRNPDPTDEEKQLLTQVLDGYEGIKVPLRDCSPEGIENFFDK